MMSIFSGIDNGIPTADMNPGELVPVSSEQLEWPRWGVYYETGGAKGAAPTVPTTVELVNFYKEWHAAATTEERAQVWHRILSGYTGDGFSLATASASVQ